MCIDYCGIRRESAVESGTKEASGPSALKRLSSLGGYLLSKDTNASDLPERSLNRSLLYLKPHANTKQARDFIRKYLGSRMCKVLKDGNISGANLCESFDLQYSDISKKAMVLEPHECSLSSESMMEFEKKFKISWSTAVRKKLVQNSRDSCELLDIPPHTMNGAWMECVSSGKMVKLGRGFYCGLIDTIPNKPAVFCINGFFLAMRAEYLAASASVHYFLVEWDNAAMSWSDFRKKVIGATNPSLAHPESLRSIMNAEWEDLGLGGPLDMVRNGLHASASAFEALVERSIWLGVSLETDAHFGVHLFSSAVPATVLKEWTTNPVVRNKYVFDHMENQGSEQCLETAQELYRTSTLGMCRPCWERAVEGVGVFALHCIIAVFTNCCIVLSFLVHADVVPPSLGSVSPTIRVIKSKPHASRELSARGNTAAVGMGQPLAAARQSPERMRRLPALSPIGRPANASLLPRTKLRNAPLGSSSLDLRRQERDNHLSVPQGRYFSPEQLQQLSPPRQRPSQNNVVLSNASSPLTPQGRGVGDSRANSVTSRGSNQKKETTPSVPSSPSNQIFSI